MAKKQEIQPCPICGEFAVGKRQPIADGQVICAFCAGRVRILHPSLRFVEKRNAAGAIYWGYECSFDQLRLENYAAEVRQAQPYREQLRGQYGGNALFRVVHTMELGGGVKPRFLNAVGDQLMGDLCMDDVVRVLRNGAVVGQAQVAAVHYSEFGEADPKRIQGGIDFVCKEGTSAILIFEDDANVQPGDLLVM